MGALTIRALLFAVEKRVLEFFMRAPEFKDSAPYQKQGGCSEQLPKIS